MKRLLLSAAALCICLIMSIASPCRAGETGHYVCGVEGIKISSLPAPGIYYKQYDVFYYADTFQASRGNAQTRPDISSFVTVHRPIWVTGTKLFGADYFMTVLIPIHYTDADIRSARLHDRGWALGDICLEPLGLAWHGARWDGLFGLEVYVPTGERNPRRPAKPGKDFWTVMVSPGATFYLDEARSWAASFLWRYELHTRRHDADIRAGQDLSVEYSLSKTVGLWDVGLTGYGHWQLTDDRGTDITYNAGLHDRTLALGPEISVFVPFLKLIVNLRTLREFSVVDRTRGFMTTLSFTKMF